MPAAIQGTYAGGDPRLLEGFDGTLSTEEGSLRFAWKQVVMYGMTTKTHTGEMTWDTDAILGISVGDVAYYQGLTVGGLVPVGDELMLGALGQVGGGSSALVLILTGLGEGEGRRLIRVACTAPDASAFVSAFQRERLTRGAHPLPGVDEVDAHTKADDQAAVLRELRDLAQQQTDLLREITRLLSPSR